MQNHCLYDCKVDVYSFSLILYSIVSGEIHFTNIISINYLQRNLDDEFWPELNDDVQKSLRSLIERCCFGDTDENPIFEEIYKKNSF